MWFKTCLIEAIIRNLHGLRQSVISEPTTVVWIANRHAHWGKDLSRVCRTLQGFETLQVQGYGSEDQGSTIIGIIEMLKHLMSTWKVPKVAPVVLCPWISPAFLRWKYLESGLLAWRMHTLRYAYWMQESEVRLQDALKILIFACIRGHLPLQIPFGPTQAYSVPTKHHFLYLSQLVSAPSWPSHWVEPAGAHPFSFPILSSCRTSGATCTSTDL